MDCFSLQHSQRVLFIVLLIVLFDCSLDSLKPVILDGTQGSSGSSSGISESRVKRLIDEGLTKL